MREGSRARLIAYGVAVLATGISLAIRLLLVSLFAYHGEVMTFFPAIIISAYLGGMGPGILATFLGAAVGDYFFIEPRYTFAIRDLGSGYGLGLFVLTGVVIAVLMESLHRSRRRIESSQRRYAVTLSSIGDAVIATDIQARVTFLNPAAEALTGWAPALAVGRPLAEVFRIINEQTQQLVEDPAAKVLRSGTAVGLANHTALLAKDGRVVPIDDCGTPIIDHRGAIAGVVLVFRDVTQRRQAEEGKAFRESERRWRNLTEALPQLVWSAMPDGMCDYFSAQWTEHTGVAEADLLGWRWLVTLHPEDRERTRQFWLESVAGRHPYDVEYRVRRRDGEYRWFKTRGVPIRDGAGNIVKWFGSCTDITDLRQTEEALRASERRFRGTFENAAVGIAHTNPRGRFLRVNEKFCDIVGYPRDELLKKTFHDITHPDDLAASIDPFAALMRDESSSFRLEKRYISKNGSPIWVELFVSPQRDTGGEPAYAIAVIQNISERKRLDAELRSAKETAEAANRAKDEFLANVSHEIRTPMNAIIGMTELALDTPLTDDQQQCLKIVKSAADSLLSIINDLLDFAKIEAGKLELDSTEFSLRAAVGDTVQALAVRAHGKGLELVCNVQPDVPDTLLGDAGRLRQVLLNLVSNAIKFTERGEVDVQVRSEMGPIGPSSQLLEARLHFSVRDTGIGIPKDQQERIFRAFEQEDTSTTRKYGGTGLGLTISSRLVALMGGQIGVESEPGLGSTFVFTARFGQPKLVSAGMVSGARSEATAITPHYSLFITPLRILVAEDNEFNAQLLEQLLGRIGHRVRLATNGREALRLMEEMAFDLLLLDVHMPELDGFEVVRAVRRREQMTGYHLPIIALTARSRKEDRELCLAAGMDDFLAKPIQAADLSASIERVLLNNESSALRSQPTAHHSPPTAPDSPFATRLLDPHALLAACGGDADILDKIGQTFRAVLPDHMRAITKALEDWDAPKLREAAHKLAGMVAAFSTVAGSVASELEDYAAQGQLKEAQNLAGPLAEMAELLMQQAERLSLDALREQARSV